MIDSPWLPMMRRVSRNLPHRGQDACELDDVENGENCCPFGSEVCSGLIGSFRPRRPLPVFPDKQTFLEFRRMLKLPISEVNASFDRLVSASWQRGGMVRRAVRCSFSRRNVLARSEAPRGAQAQRDWQSSSPLRFQCRSLGSATAGIFKLSRAVCTRTTF